MTDIEELLKTYCYNKEVDGKINYYEHIFPDLKIEVGIGCSGKYADSIIDMKYWNNVINADEKVEL